MVPDTIRQKKLRDLTEDETAELELATDEALGRVEPPPKSQHLNPGEEKGYLNRFLPDTVSSPHRFLPPPFPPPYSEE